MQNTQIPAQINKQTVLKTATVALFVIAVLTFPYAFNTSWAAPANDASRTITYASGDLTWDSAAEIDEDGAIVLSMFKDAYTTTASSNGDKIVAPTTQNSTSICLKNDSADNITYTAVLYRLDDTNLPVNAKLKGGQDTSDYTLPESVSADQVVSAVTDNMSASTLSNIDINWAWNYETSTAEGTTDEADTTASSLEDAPKVKYGFYVVVSDDEYVPPTDMDGTGKSSGIKALPKTGDNTPTLWIFILAVLALAIMLLSLFANKRRKKQDNTAPSNSPSSRNAAAKIPPTGATRSASHARVVNKPVRSEQATQKDKYATTTHKAPAPNAVNRAATTNTAHKAPNAARKTATSTTHKVASSTHKAPRKRKS